MDKFEDLGTYEGETMTIPFMSKTSANRFGDVLLA